MIRKIKAGVGIDQDLAHLRADVNPWRIKEVVQEMLRLAALLLFGTTSCALARALTRARTQA